MEKVGIQGLIGLGNGIAGQGWPSQSRLCIKQKRPRDAGVFVWPLERQIIAGDWK
jgi:hypothetical protein